MKNKIKILLETFFIFLLSGCSIVNYDVKTEITDDSKFNLHYTYEVSKYQGNSYTIGLSDMVSKMTDYEVKDIEADQKTGIEVYNTWDDFEQLCVKTDIDLEATSETILYKINEYQDQITSFDIDNFITKNKNDIKLFYKKEYDDKIVYFSYLFYTPRIYYIDNSNEEVGPQLKINDITYDPNDDMANGSEFYFSMKLPSVAKNIISNANIEKDDVLDLSWELSYKDLTLNDMYLYFEIPKEVNDLDLTKSLSDLQNNTYKIIDFFKIDEDDIIWKTSDESIAKIEEGKIIALKSGIVNITGVGNKNYNLHLIINDDKQDEIIMESPNTKVNNRLIIISLIISINAVFLIIETISYSKREN